MSIADALFSKTQQQVLGLLYGSPNRDFYTNEIIKLSQSGTGAVQRELIKLANAGIITMKEMGNQKRYQANSDMPFYDELRSIIIKTFGLVDVLRAALVSFGDKIEVAFVYGSVARNEDVATSDIDVMMITDTLSYSDFFKNISKVEESLKRKVNPIFYTKGEWVRKVNEKNHFLVQLIKQEKLFLIGSENGLKSIGKPRKEQKTKERII